MRSGFRFLLITVWATLAHAVINFVPDDFIGLQEALFESNSNDTIVCRSGTYSGPFHIPERNITIASEFILSGNDAYIAECVVRPHPAAPENGCIDTRPMISCTTLVRIVGMTISDGHAIESEFDKGGGLHIRNRIADIQNCVFKSNSANWGGAIFADSSQVYLRNTMFAGNDAWEYGSSIYLKRSDFYIDSCDFGPSAAILQCENSYQGEFHLDGGSVVLKSTKIHDIGYTAEGPRLLFWTYESQATRQVTLYGCTIERCNLLRFSEGAGASEQEIVIDSCIFRDNETWTGLILPGHSPSLRYISITRSRFENNTYPDNTAGGGLLFIGGAGPRFVCEDNYFVNNYGATYSCILARSTHNPALQRIQRNYIIRSGSNGYQIHTSTPILLDRVRNDSVLSFNAIRDNIGHGAYTLDWFSPTSYALHNFWGDSTGPYEATRNPGGLGDTTNAATIYDEWLLSEDEIPDTSLFPPPNAADDRRWTVPSTWFISSVYPNPFNSEFQIELDGMTGADFEVRLFDLLGREVALLHSGRTLRGTLSFQAPRDLAAGVYFLHAKDHLYAETKKVLYLK